MANKDDIQLLLCSDEAIADFIDDLETDAQTEMSQDVAANKENSEIVVSKFK